MAVSVLVEITRRHLSERPPWQPTELAASFGVSTLENLVGDFVRAGILLRSSEPEGVALAKAPESVTVKDILDIVADPAAQQEVNDSGPAVAILMRRDQAVQEAVEGITLKSLAAETPANIVKLGHPGANVQSP